MNFVFFFRREYELRMPEGFSLSSERPAEN